MCLPSNRITHSLTGEYIRIAQQEIISETLARDVREIEFIIHLKHIKISTTKDFLFLSNGSIASLSNTSD